MIPRVPMIALVLAATGLISVHGTARAQRGTGAMLPPTMADTDGGFVSVRNGQSMPTVATRPLTLTLDGVPFGEALRKVADQAGLRLAYRSDLLIPTSPVRVDAQHTEAHRVFRAVLVGTALDVLINANGSAVVVPLAATDQQGSTEVTGRVTDARTGDPVSAATVRSRRTGASTTTNADGRYRLAGLPGGQDVIIAERLGYAPAQEEISLPSDGSVSLDLVLTADAVELDRVVVTGSRTPTPAKAVPTPVTVITAEELDRRGVERVEDIFRGMLPGVVTYDIGTGGYSNSIRVRGAADLQAGTSMKVYMDGVEVANPDFLFNLDPAIIERVEMIRGPQAGAMYGSDAIGGVLQIFTRKGEVISEPRFKASTQVGYIESDYGDGAVRQEHTVALTGGDDAFSFNLTGTYWQHGEWIEEGNDALSSMAGGAKGSVGRVSFGFSGRYMDRTLGLARSPALRQAFPDLDSPLRREGKVRQQTFGVNLEVPSHDRWTHTLVLGFDRNVFEAISTEPLFRVPEDTLLQGISAASTAKVSADYSTHLELGPADGPLRGTVSAGFNYWSSETQFVEVADVPSARGFLDGTIFPPVRDKYSNRGIWMQGQVRMREALFVTGGLRAEYNDNFGSDYGAALAPRVGVAYVREIGSVTARVRGSWGRAIRPPSSIDRLGFNSPFEVFVANPDLGPEIQEGWDAGIDLELGSRAAFRVTRYDQTARDLIDLTLLGVTDEGLPIFQSQNVGEVANEGWEVEAELTLAPILLEATYSTTANEVLALPDGYLGSYQVGDRVLGVPSANGSLTVGLLLARVRAFLDVLYVGDSVNNDNLALFGYYLGIDPFRGSLRDYWIEYDGFVDLGLRGSVDVTPQLRVFLSVRNLSNRNEPERTNLDVIQGRRTSVGLRWNP